MVGLCSMRCLYWREFSVNVYARRRDREERRERNFLEEPMWNKNKEIAETVAQLRSGWIDRNKYIVYFDLIERYLNFSWTCSELTTFFFSSKLIEPLVLNVPLQIFGKISIAELNVTLLQTIRPVTIKYSIFHYPWTTMLIISNLCLTRISLWILEIACDLQ